MTLAIHGVGVSRGIAIGKAHLLRHNHVRVSERPVPATLIEAEVTRYRQALHRAKQQLRDIHSEIPSTTPTDITAFIDAHLLMLDDYTLAEAPIQLIRENRCNAEWALKLQRDALVRVFDEMDDPYLRTRRDDVDHVVNRIVHLLLAEDEEETRQDSARLKDAIIIAEDLTPADMLLMHQNGVLACVTEFGAPISHTAILARSLGMPAVVGVRHASRYLRDDEPVIVDGQKGVILADAAESILRHYRLRQTEEAQHLSRLGKLRAEEAKTEDGLSISLQANIDFPEDIHAVHQLAASGVGLYRTEFLYINRELPPDEEEQFETYRSVIEQLRGVPLTIRTLDIGADKQTQGGRTGSPAGVNPAMGLRAIRLCLREPGLFMPQLLAILRASTFGPVRLLIPMLSSPTELVQIRQMMQNAQRELDQRGEAYDPNMPVGGMIEVPAAAISAHVFAHYLDFLSIGTNDLIQYTLAIDRIDDEVGYLYDPLHPSVLYLLHRVIDAGRKAGIPVAMCGEMAGDPRYTRLLLGLGLTEFSMHPNSLLEIKRVVNATRVDGLSGLVGRVLDSIHLGDIRALMDELNEGLEF